MPGQPTGRRTHEELCAHVLSLRRPIVMVIVIVVVIVIVSVIVSVLLAPAHSEPWSGKWRPCHPSALRVGSNTGARRQY